VSVVLYHGSGAQDFSLETLNPSIGKFEKLRANVRDLLRVRGHQSALRLLSLFPFQLHEASNYFNDDFHVLHATVALDLYEEARQLAGSQTDRAAAAQLAETVSEIGPYVRFVAVSLDPNRNVEATNDGRGLKRSEINRLVYKYIGVEGGYLGDFSYQKHHDFYVDLDLDVNPFNYSGTTRDRFIKILSEATPDVQARILCGILGRYPENSAPIRTQSMRDEIETWIRRLTATGAVAAPSLKITSQVVERALGDAEQLLASTGATSGVDRVHTALHGYLLQVCSSANIAVPEDASLTQVFKLMRTGHSAFSDLGPRPEDIGRVLNSLAVVMDVVNPIRNRASVAHPNAELLPEAEAMLVINAGRSILHYLDSKLSK
jgi:hypothetical protein